MKNIYLRILLYALITIVIFAVFWQVSAIKETENLRRKFGHISPLGNILSAYFYMTNTTDKDDILRHDFLASMSTDYALQKLYRHLDWSKQYNTVDYKAKFDAAWHQIDDDGNPKPNYLLFWQTVRPVMQKLYAKAIRAEKIDHPIVHFRCSDSPFNKHLQYHMPKVDTVKWMAQQIKSRGYDKITMLCCNKHWSLDTNSCNKYANFYGSIFKDEGIDYSIQCNSIAKDFALMVSTPMLVSLNESSYSFMAGIAKDPKNYVSCNMGRETIDGKYHYQTEGDWILDYRQPLLHTYVKDYHDTNDVINRLTS